MTTKVSEANHIDVAWDEHHSEPADIVIDTGVTVRTADLPDDFNELLADARLHDGHVRDFKAGIRSLFIVVGEDASREGLQETPDRVFKAWLEMTKGYSVDVASLLKTFDAEGHDNMVTLSRIKFYSTCEHHLLPFTGYATVSYLPNERIVGLSKLARIVEVFSRRLQNQERLTSQIAQALFEGLSAKGVGVQMQGAHFCMMCRGVGQQEGVMTTTSLLGAYKEPTVRAEFLTQCK